MFKRNWKIYIAKIKTERGILTGLLADSAIYFLFSDGVRENVCVCLLMHFHFSLLFFTAADMLNLFKMITLPEQDKRFSKVL